MLTKRQFLKYFTVSLTTLNASCTNFGGFGHKNYSGRARKAKSLVALYDQVNDRFPDRAKNYDGFFGDTAHCPGSSDHCPNVIDGNDGVVTALDITHDPLNNCDMNEVVESIIKNRDKRIKYIIWNEKICSSSRVWFTEPWEWRKYNGSNTHSKHAHFSVIASKELYDDESSWSIG